MYARSAIRPEYEEARLLALRTIVASFNSQHEVHRDAFEAPSFYFRSL